MLGKPKKLKEVKKGWVGLDQTHKSRLILGGFGIRSACLLVVIKDNCSLELKQKGPRELSYTWV